MLANKQLIILLLLSLSAMSEIPDDRNTQEVPTERADALTQGKYGMTWGYTGYTKVAQETFHVSCSGTPVVPNISPYNGNSGQCNAYKGDTPCNHVLPVLCISPCGYKRPCYDITCGPHAMPAEYYCGWSESLILLSNPVAGSSLTSQAAGDKICQNQFGPKFRMGEHHDGKYVIGMSSTNSCYSTWPSGASTGGWGFYGYGVKGPVWTRFWVAIIGQNANCWNS